MKVHRILFPTDFSEAAWGALEQAVYLAEIFSASLVFLHVRTPHSDDPSRPEQQLMEEGDWKALVAKADARLVERLEKCRGIQTVLVREFNPAEAILEFALEEKIDLTVMGTHGRSLLAHLFLGSVAEQVVRLSPTPVLTVATGRDGYRKGGPYRNIVVAFDFSEHAVHAAAEAARLARRLGARLDLYFAIEQVVPPVYAGIWRNSIQQEIPRIEEAMRESLAEALGEGPGPARTHVEIVEGKAPAGIVRFARQQQADLIVMGSHGLSGLDHLLLGSTAERVVRTAASPVLTFTLGGSAGGS